MKKTNEEWNIVDVLSHSRHDWMNKLQLIKGNLSLNRHDRVQQIIEEIVIETQSESKLCNLKMLSFASLLMTFNWKRHHYSLEYEVLGAISDLSEYDLKVTEWCKQFFQILDDSVDRCTENHLSITIETEANQGQVRFFFDFNGIITEKALLLNWLKSNEKNQVSVMHYELSPDELTVAVGVA
ncbi:sporulation initiation phosphotransferase B [Bacillus sp. CMF21]|jgi:stage 0 sporulation protein B (sporulation initiation phosphotransferase)|uniref:sporulation initiation phosphotransferase B n=1 Tax=Metabacillus dongyingensis TaxID=2874282 RepID=UPI001CBC1807|nr:sporulation initiation phosphotransferase B [Metabacillus dongyingensis]UAL51178.1 sporulation initiation phosphotransferase B [Metabacillus dongyingensis]USK27472.1 sporulation initiation phosphotransferase B [Bacillus sp. CMF21]